MEKFKLTHWIIYIDYSNGDEVERVDMGPYLIPPPKVGEIHTLADNSKVEIIRFNNESDFTNGILKTKVYIKKC